MDDCVFISLVNGFLFLFSCANQTSQKENILDQKRNFFKNKGFALIYNDKLYKDNIVNNKIDDRSLIIFQKNLKAETSVKVTNLLNSKHLKIQ